MKRIYALLVLTLLSLHAAAQVPQAINYQAVARDGAGLPLINHTVGIQLSILTGSATGSAVYVERFTPMTNAAGLFVLQIGTGVVQSGEFAYIDWNYGSKFLKVEMDPAGGTAYTVQGTSQFVSVPYAMISGRATGMLLRDLVDVTETVPLLDNVLAWDGYNWTPSELTQYWTPAPGGATYNYAGTVSINTTPMSNYQFAVANTITGSGPGGSIYGRFGNAASSSWYGTANLKSGITGTSQGSSGVIGISDSANGVWGISKYGDAVFGMSEHGTGGHFYSLNSNAIYAANFDSTEYAAVIFGGLTGHGAGLQVAGTTHLTGSTAVGPVSFPTSQMLEVEGGVRIGAVDDANGTEGTLRYHSGTFQGYDGTAWNDLGGTGVGANYWTLTDSNIVNNNGGSVSINALPVSNFKLNVTGGGTISGIGGAILGQYGNAGSPGWLTSSLIAAVTGTSAGKAGVLGVSDSSNGLYGVSRYSNGVSASSDYGAGGFFTSQHGSAIAAYNYDTAYYAASISGASGSASRALFVNGNSVFLGKVGIGSWTPTQSLEVSGGIRIGTVADASGNTGTIRFNAVTNTFQGYNGTSWNDFDGSMANYWTFSGGNIQNNNSGLVTVQGAQATAAPFNIVNDSTGSFASGIKASVGSPSTISAWHGSVEGTSVKRIGVVGLSDSSWGVVGYSQYSTGGAFLSNYGVALTASTGAPGVPAASVQGYSLNDKALYVYGRTGLGTSSPTQTLDVNGAIHLGTIPDASGNAGAMRYNTTTNTFQGYNGTSWSDFGGGSGSSNWTQTGSNLYPALSASNVGIGTTTPVARLQVNGTILSTGTTGSTPISGGGTRMMWIPAKFAFRAGKVTSTEWDDANIGTTSAAFGYNNIASGASSFAAGETNTVTSSYSTSFGFANIVSQPEAFTSGYDNQITDPLGGSSASSAFGLSNRVKGFANFAAGNSHRITNSFGIALGNTDSVSGYAAVAIGDHSTASGNTSVAIGNQVVASGQTSLATGYLTTSSGAYSTAMGSEANTNDMHGAFVIGDEASFGGGPFTWLYASADNQFSARFTNGYRLYTDATCTYGVQLLPGASSWSFLSDSTKKTNFRKVDGGYILQSIALMKAGTWNYKKQDAAHFRHYGPMAQEFFHYFGHDQLGTIGCDTLITSQDMEGILFLAVQELSKRTEQLKQSAARVEELQKEQASLEQRLTTLEAVIQKQQEQNTITAQKP